MRIVSHPDQHSKYTCHPRELVNTVSAGASPSVASPQVTSYKYTDRRLGGDISRTVEQVEEVGRHWWDATSLAQGWVTTPHKNKGHWRLPPFVKIS
ncbi:hypothetical protein ACIBKZ_32345 [Streptomyces sp. NPDC050421]|uniref:hypothetical protein n=1 Tax=unclassified Streptomyces TaxID=2593676 RepID=UPI0037970E1D